MKRRELGTALIGAAAYSVLPGGAQAQSPGAPYYSPTAAEMSASSRGVVVKQPEYSPSPIYDMARYGLTANNAGNHPKNGEIGAANSRIMQAVFAMVAATGGTIEFPHGDWSFHLDISGINNTVIIEGNGSTFRTFNPAAPGGASESSALKGTQLTRIRDCTAALTWRGNGSGRGGPLLPTSLVLTHDGPTYIDGPNYGSSLSK